ncbi:hypothetical protein SPRG_20006 [Saprolegnia parasitica CBS 223.65]|uniref:RRM domain-containing protein n=1 Tax=Saprolegnia parasitica (strain CBS 223.65) TaxID=695850 RepID=A0A067CDH1_SAPPC|nr:hypothetical protein SPRG_20006 [Saprolegnia parasitica CBS 223.65]KDO28799.1 hypothetical protein SPRG_20006 [Saprolegnia parasitica CBS 223.65]|eukprot:XP_012200536.1 hypothetical protein SPRG_20006 [Saprolegnia parasitica CBS 223.65]
MAHLVSVQNLAPALTIERLRAAFKRFGKLVSVDIRDNGTGAIVYEKATSVNKATMAMNNAVVLGKRMTVVAGESQAPASSGVAAPLAERGATGFEASTL